MEWLKAKLLLLSISVVWIFFILAMLPLQLPVTLLAIKFKRLRGYRYKLWISQDQLVNAIHNGNPDVTVSSRIGYMAYHGSKTAKVMASVVDWLFYIAIGQKNHCFVSIEWDEEH
jgi:hypothetical protein